MNTCEDCNKNFVSNFPADKCNDCENVIVTYNYDGSVDHRYAQKNIKKASKNRLDLVPPELTLAAGRAFTNGLKKYAENDWKGKPKEMFEAAFLRHFYEYLLGETEDAESGLHPLDHAAANLAILIDKCKENKKA